MTQVGSLPVPSRSTWSSVLSLLRGIGFWGSVMLPATYVPLMYGLDGSRLYITLAGIVTLNILCLVAGHRYSP